MASLAYTIIKSNTIRRAVNLLEQKIPPLRAWHRCEYEEHFARLGPNQRLFSGVFATFAEAEKAMPQGVPSGLDHLEAANRHAGYLGHIWPSDYPIIFWLSRLLGRPATILDLGGNIGLAYYDFQKYFLIPAESQWIVCELPRVVELGRSYAAQKGVTNLFFTANIGEAESAEILLTCGALQFIEKPLADTLKSFDTRPRHVLVNRIPLCKGPRFVTLSNNGRSISPYLIQNRAEFVTSMEKAGYEVIDSWENPDFGCDIPWHPEKRVRAYTGMYFRLSDCAR